MDPNSDKTSKATKASLRMQDNHLVMQQGTYLPDYAELFCLSNFTFLHGASHAEELVARAVKLGYRALAITDECSLAGVVRAHEEAKKHDITLLIGTHFRVTDPHGNEDTTLIALAQNREGYGNLSELITLARTRTLKGSYLLTLDDFTAPAASGMDELDFCTSRLDRPQFTDPLHG